MSTTNSAFDIAVTIVTAAATGGVAIADFARADFVLANSAEVRVRQSWLPALGALKLLGAIGICVGLAGIAPIGVMAATGLTLFFAGAVVAHVRVGVYHNIAFPLGYLVLSVASLVVAAASAT